MNWPGGVFGGVRRQLLSMFSLMPGICWIAEGSMPAVRAFHKAIPIPVVIVCAFSVAALPAWAHHSFAAEFDGRKAVTFTGTLDKVEWTNPHAHILVSVQKPDGATAEWNFELSSPNVLLRQGWTRDAMKPGDAVAIVGYPAKDGSRLASALSVTRADGKRIFARPSEDGGPPK